MTRTHLPALLLLLLGLALSARSALADIADPDPVAEVASDPLTIVVVAVVVVAVGVLALVLRGRRRG